MRIYFQQVIVTLQLMEEFPSKYICLAISKINCSICIMFILSASYFCIFYKQKRFVVWHFVLLCNITAVTAKYIETMKPLFQRIKKTSGEIYSSTLMNQFNACLFIMLTVHMRLPEALEERRKLRPWDFILLCAIAGSNFSSWWVLKSDNFTLYQ